MKNQLQTLIEGLVHQALEEMNYLEEGGLGGHMMHLYDNQFLTFGDMKEIFRLATDAQLDDVTEKIDGQNIFFSFDIRSQELKFSRNKTNIRTGGMDFEDILNKWQNSPNIRDAFATAYQVLNKAIRSLGMEKQRKIFGPNLDVWYSGEVVASISPNVINYDRDAFVIHHGGTSWDDNGNPLDIDNSASYQELMNSIDSMRQVVGTSKWDILGPVVVKMSREQSKKPYEEATAKLNALMQEYGMGDGNKILDYLAARFSQDFLGKVDVPDNQKEDLARVIANRDMKVTEKKNIIKSITQDNPMMEKYLIKVAQQSTDASKKYIAPLESIVHDFAVNVLSSVQSALAMYPNKEVQRVRGLVGHAIDTIQSNATAPESFDFLEKQLSKLKSVDSITSSLEGITFKYKGDMYKLTGNFAPINQILGMLTFGRAGYNPQ